MTHPELIANQRLFIIRFSFASTPQLFLPLRAFLQPHVLAVAALSLPFLPDQGFCAGSSPTPLFSAINSLKSLASWFIFFFPMSVLHSFKAMRGGEKKKNKNTQPFFFQYKEQKSYVVAA